ncbi:MAG: hypothetical protein HC782_00410 [Gammaproteobacteria bacterium]|nr:hypothetical protein [Gammaproteobacteria bacterium]
MLARKLAIDLTQVKGTGPAGRILIARWSLIRTLPWPISMIAPVPAH